VLPEAPPLLFAGCRWRRLIPKLSSGINRTNPEAAEGAASGNRELMLAAVIEAVRRKESEELR
jgi:hypothetical protein